MYFIKFHFSPRVMKRQSSILRSFSQLSAKRREIGIDDELVSISPTNCAKEQESSVSGCNEDPGATNNTLSLELVGVSLQIHSGASSLQHLDLHVLSDSDRTAKPCVETCSSAAGASGQTVTSRPAALSMNDFNPPYDMGDLYTIANQLSELER